VLDFHSHVMPGVDDGATDDEEAAAALQAFAEQGVRVLVATPHVSGLLTLRPDTLHARLVEIDAGWARLERIAAAVPALEVHRGAEVMLDTPSPDFSDPRLRLAGGPFVLVEFPYMSVPPRSEAVLQHIAVAGRTPVVAHPERYHGVSVGSALPAEWKQAGARLQVNSGSITGRYGQQARENAFDLLERGLADYLCSDYHSRGLPATGKALLALTEAQADEQADLLVRVNPLRLLDGAQPLPVPPLPRQAGLMQRLREWLR
jgi:protein-tyrosine phosphatase